MLQMFGIVPAFSTKQRLTQQNLTLDVSADAKKLLASEGYDPQFGARPLNTILHSI